MPKPSKNNIDQLNLFSRIPIEYSFGDCLLDKVKDDIKGVLGDSESIAKDLLTGKIRQKLNDALEIRHLKADIYKDKIVISPISHTDRSDEYEASYRHAI